MTAIKSSNVDVDENVTGHEWTVSDVGELARLIAIILLGQAEHAAQIIRTLEPSIPVATGSDLIEEAKAQMQLKGTTREQRFASRVHRDGFLFECISWIAARQAGDDRTFLKDPHLDPTNHGLDGLIVQLAPKEPEVVRATICEDKCTKAPREKFRDEVMKTFGEHHNSAKRSRDLIANAVELIRDSGVTGSPAVRAAAKVTDKSIRCYRAALTTRPLVTEGRVKLYKGYDGLNDIDQNQRVGANFPLDIDLRYWFAGLAVVVVKALDAFEDPISAKLKHV